MCQLFVLDVPLSVSQMTQFGEQVRIRVISQFIKGISGVLQNFPRCFSGTTISTSTLQSWPLLLVKLDLNLNDSECVMLPSGSSPQYYHKRPDVFE